MTFMVSDNQYGQPHPSGSWASCSVVLHINRAVECTR